MYFIIKGDVAVFKNREEADYESELEFYNKGKRIPESLFGDKDIASFDDILYTFDKKSISSLSRLSDSIVGSSFV